MRRRAFITLGGAAVAWPLVASAQRPALPVVAVVYGGGVADAGRVAAPLRKGLSETGYVEGQNATVEYHWLEGQLDRLPSLMAAHPCDSLPQGPCPARVLDQDDGNLDELQKTRISPAQVFRLGVRTINATTISHFTPVALCAQAIRNHWAIREPAALRPRHELPRGRQKTSSVNYPMRKAASL